MTGEQEKAEALAAEFGRKFRGEWYECDAKRGFRRGEILVSAAMGGVLLVAKDCVPVNLTYRERERREEMGHNDLPDGCCHLEAIFVEPTEIEGKALNLQAAKNRAAALRAMAADDARSEGAYREAMVAVKAAQAEYDAAKGVQ